MPASRDTLADTSQGPGSERPTKVVSRKHSIYNHFPKDRNGKIFKRNKITGAPCRKLTGVAVHRAENFGDLIAADHKSNHSMDAILSVQHKNFSGMARSLRNFFEPSEKPKVFYTENSLEFGKSFEE